MSDRERASALLERVPDYKIEFVIAFLQGLTAGESIPNNETVAAMKEYEEGTGQRYSGSTADIFASVLAEGD